MLTHTSYKHIWKVSYPIILGGVAQTIINVTDTAFMGRIGEVAIGASAIAALFYVTFFILGFGFSVGAQIIMARLDGEGNQKNIGSVFVKTFIFLQLLALGVYLFLKFPGPGLLEQFVKSPQILEAALAYIDQRAWGLFFAFAGLTIRAFYIGISNTRMVIYSTAISALSNIVFNYIFVFGTGSIPAMGIAGSALASSLSEVLATLFSFMYVLYFGHHKKYGLFKVIPEDRVSLSSVLKIASPIMFQNFIALFSWFVFFMIVEQMGEHELAISNLVRNVYMILMIPLMGFSSATNTLVSNLIGQGKKEDVFRLMKRIMMMSFMFTLGVTAINALVPGFSLGIFTGDPQLITDTVPSIFVISGSILIFSFTAVALSTVSGTGNTVASLVIETLTILFYLAATYLVAVKYRAGIEWVWSVEYVYFLFMGALALLYLLKGNWRKA